MIWFSSVFPQKPRKGYTGITAHEVRGMTAMRERRSADRYRTNLRPPLSYTYLCAAPPALLTLRSSSPRTVSAVTPVTFLPGLPKRSRYGERERDASANKQAEVRRTSAHRFGERNRISSPNPRAEVRPSSVRLSCSLTATVPQRPAAASPSSFSARGEKRIWGRPRRETKKTKN